MGQTVASENCHQRDGLCFHAARFAGECFIRSRQGERARL